MHSFDTNKYIQTNMNIHKQKHTQNGTCLHTDTPVHIIHKHCMNYLNLLLISLILLFYQISVKTVIVNKPRFTKGVTVKYKVSIVNDKEFTETKMISGAHINHFNHTRVITISKIKQEHLDFFEQGSITFCVYGKQEDTGPAFKLSKMTTKVIILFILFHFFLFIMF